MFFRKNKLTNVFAGLLLSFTLGLQGISPVWAAGTIYRVSTTGATTGACGADWDNPCDLQYALSMATSGSEIWVKSGTYYPDQGFGQTPGDRISTFALKNGVALYGGFAGTETLRSERNSDPVQNGTILSGDIGVIGVNDDNAYHVLEASFLPSSPTLDGFTVTGGNANGALNNFGGGLYNNESNTVLKNIIFTKNFSNGGGGGIFIISQRSIRTEYFAPTLDNVIFMENSAPRGGGILTQNSSPILTNVTFKENKATNGNGGAMVNWTLHPATDESSAPILTNVTFSGNTANGGGGGGLYNSNSQPILTNVTFSGNSSSLQGGAIFNEGADPTFRNVTISGNTAPSGSGGAIRSAMLGSITSDLTIENSILWNDASEEFSSDGTGSLTIVDSIVQGGCPINAACTNILTTDPVLSGLANNGGFTQTMALGRGSAAIDTGGSNSTCAADDQRGASRPQSSGCDIGAFEAYLLTVTADSKTITYGDAEPVFSFHYTGLLDGDTAAAIDTAPICGVAGAHTNAGTYTITCSGGADNKYLLNTYVDGILIINKATPTLSVINSPVTYDSAPHSALVISFVPGKVTNVLTGGLPSQTNAGTYAVTANFTPTDAINYNTLNNAPAGDFIVNKATPTLSVTNPLILYDGAAHTAIISSSVPGVVSNILVGGAASQTNIGKYPVTASFTPTDIGNYNSLVEITVGQLRISPDIIAPGTQIDFKPVSPSDRNVSFKFSSDDATATFECKLDNDVFSACTNPKSYVGLENGSHTFMVRAIDSYENVDDTPASHTWIVTAHQTYYLESSVIPPSSLTTVGGDIDGFTSDFVKRLWYLEQSTMDDNANAYINYQTFTGVYDGYRTFYIPDGIQTTFISSMLLQVNFNGPAISSQTWTWSIYDWNSNLWIKIGDTIGSTPNEWNSMPITIRNIRRYISPGHEIRIRLQSNNANGNLKVDYEALHITYRVMTVNPSPSAPTVPANRPGIASVSVR